MDVEPEPDFFNLDRNSIAWDDVARSFEVVESHSVILWSEEDGRLTVAASSTANWDLSIWWDEGDSDRIYEARGDQADLDAVRCFVSYRFADPRLNWRRVL